MPMDLISLQQYFTPFLGVVVVILVIHFLSSIAKSSKHNTAPEAPGALPILGHLNIFGGPLGSASVSASDPPHKVLGSMAIKYGPIFIIRLGIRRVLVVNNWEIAKEIFTTHDAIVSSRPKFTAAKILGYNYVMFGVTPYGPYWRGMRKITSLKLLSSSRLEQLKHVRLSELESSIRNLYEIWREKKDGLQGKVLVKLDKWFGELNMNVMLRMIAGIRYTNGEKEEEMIRFQKSIREFFDFLGRFVVADCLPFLGWLDLGGHEKAMKRVSKEIDSIVGKWLKEHRRKKDTGEAIDNNNDFMDVMISAVETGDFVDYDADAVIKSTCLDIIASSVDTITAMLTWTVSLLLDNPHALQKAQEEINNIVGKDRKIDDSDISKLFYLQAIIKETLRLYPAAPLGAPREFSKDCTVAGYHVPKGTWLMVNIWNLQRDPEIWSDPSEFRPERFLTPAHMHVDVKGRNFELVPFGAGRRYCPGLALSLQMLHIVVATLLHNFDISLPNDERVDMTESAGLINAKASPLEIQIVPRLPSTVW